MAAERFVLVIALALCACSSDDESMPAATGAQTATAPSAPSELTVAPLGLGLHVTWIDNADDEDDFVIERHDGNGEFEELFTLPFDSTTYHDEGDLVSGTEYTYRIGALNAAGTSYSDEVTASAP